MITTILSILGVIFLIWIGIVFIWNLILYVIYKYVDDIKYTYLRRSTVLCNTEYNDWYIIPSVSFYINNVCKYPTITFVWLKWQFTVCYHFMTEEEEQIEFETRKKYLNQKVKEQ